VTLTADVRAQLLELLSKGKAAARTLTRARVLLKAVEGVHGPRLTDEQFAEAVEVNRSTVELVRMRCVDEGVAPASITPVASAQTGWSPGGASGLTLACSPAPKGRRRWSLRLLSDKLVELEIVNEISHETLRQTLKRSNSSTMTRSGGCGSGLLDPRTTRNRPPG